MANGDWGSPPSRREQNLEQEVERLRCEVARLRAELDKAGYKRRYNPIYGWTDYLREKGQENDRP